MKAIHYFLPLLLLATTSAFALGPIPNGTYEGKITCSAPSTKPFDMAVKLTFTNDTLVQDLDGDVSTRHFVFTDAKNFRVNPDQENGHGYLTADGLYFELTIRGTTGRDSYRYRNGALEEVGTAVYDGETFSCQGVHRKK